jgi:hypothetical protein
MPMTVLQQQQEQCLQLCMACGLFGGHTLSTQKQARAGNTWSLRPKAPIEMMQTGKVKDEERIYGSAGLKWGGGLYETTIIIFTMHTLKCVTVARCIRLYNAYNGLWVGWPVINIQRACVCDMYILHNMM